MNPNSPACAGMVQRIFYNVANGLTGPVPIAYQMLPSISINQNLLAFAYRPGRQLTNGLRNQFGHAECLLFKRDVSCVQPCDFQHGLYQIFHVAKFGAFYLTAYSSLSEM